MDRVEIIVVGGDGGHGLVSFRHEKFVPFGGPDGGDGGGGGYVYITTDRRVTSLDTFRHKRRFKAASGKSGGKQKKRGSKGDDLVIGVPIGTMVFSRQDGQEVFLADLSREGEKVLVAKGGDGGLGNAHFATSRVQAPRTATQGGRGEEFPIILEYRMIADVAIIGYPNAGKSSLVATISKANPKIADYPFTTCDPVRGVVEVGMETFIVVEIPALVQDAHLGKGLGNEFLRHAERTKVLLHLLDGSTTSIVDDKNNLDAELALYKPTLAKKPRLVVINKVDLLEVQARLPELKKLFSSRGIKVFCISAITKQGVPELVSEIVKMLEEVGWELSVSEIPVAVFRPKPKVKRGK